MTMPTKCSLSNHSTYPEPADIETIFGGKKIVRTQKSKESFLAYDKDEMEYERLVLSQFRDSDSFEIAPLNFKLWVAQRIQLIERFILEYYNA